MITPPGRSGVAFTEKADGDQRAESSSRLAVAEALGIPHQWATVSQVHGVGVVRVSDAGQHGAADSLWTTKHRLPLAVLTADCFGVVLHSQSAVGVAHAGWRGVRGGVLRELRTSMTEAGHEPLRADVGPGIGPCCFEVGPEVLTEFTDHKATTSWDTDSVDLRAALDVELVGLDVWGSTDCTNHQDRWFSHRSDRTPSRLATIGWRE